MCGALLYRDRGTLCVARQGRVEARERFSGGCVEFIPRDLERVFIPSISLFSFGIRGLAGWSGRGGGVAEVISYLPSHDDEAECCSMPKGHGTGVPGGVILVHRVFHRSLTSCWAPSFSSSPPGMCAAWWQTGAKYSVIAQCRTPWSTDCRHIPSHLPLLGRSVERVRRSGEWLCRCMYRIQSFPARAP